MVRSPHRVIHVGKLVDLLSLNLSILKKDTISVQEYQALLTSVKHSLHSEDALTEEEISIMANDYAQFLSKKEANQKVIESEHESKPSDSEPPGPQSV